MLNETNEFESVEALEEELHQLCKELQDALRRQVDSDTTN